MKNNYEFTRKTAEERKKEIDELAKKIDDGVKQYLNSDKYKELLNNISNFHNYSFNNCVLISMQKPEATRVASYSVWDAKFHRNVEAGEKGIKVLCPVDRKVEVQQDKRDPITNEPILDSNGNRVQENVTKNFKTFKVGYVFDVSQTKQDPNKSVVEIEMAKELKGDVQGYDDLVTAIKNISKSDIEFAQITGGAKGYFAPLENEIKVKEGMDQAQTFKTLVHETVHSRLHNLESDLHNEQQNIKEIQAESCAYIVCNHFGVDTSDYSFPYVSSWASMKVEDVKDNMELIKKTSDSLINSIEGELKSMKMSMGEKIENEIIRKNDEHIRRVRSGL